DGAGDEAVAKFNPAGASEVAIERLRREISTLLQIDHPSVIAIIDHDMSERPWYVMPAGISFDQYWARLRAPLTPEQTFDSATQFLRQILDGLSALHAKQWIHRDVKPQNIVVINETAKL